MKRLLLVLAAAGALAALPAAVAHDGELPSELREALPTMPDGTQPSDIGHPEDRHSANMLLVGRFDDGGTYRQGSDLAFWGSTAVLGNYDNPGGFRLVDISDPTKPTELGQFSCGGSRQADVSIWRKLVFLSVDDPKVSSACGAPVSRVDDGTTWEGIRIVSIADPANPRQVAAVDTDCGSHTHTLVPDESNKRVLIYVQSYPLTAQGVNCSAATHRKISVIEVPLNDPAKARVVSTPSVAPAVGCHDVTVLVPKKLAAAACITESQIWDISDPVNPRILSHIVNPAINIHHSSAFSWDGDTVVIGDELGGALATPGCADGDPHLPLGALWFYDVSNPASPQLKSSFSIPQEEISLFCTAHNFNPVPLKSGRDVLVSAWYNGGTTVIDFTDPGNVVQLGYYIPKKPYVAAAWSSYWYRGFIYANNFDEDVHSLSPRSRGLDVFAIADKELSKAVNLPHLNPQTQEAVPALQD